MDGHRYPYAHRRPFLSHNNFEQNQEVVNKIMGDFNKEHYRRKFLSNLSPTALSDFTTPSSRAILGEKRNRELEKSKEFWEKNAKLMGPDVKNFTGAVDPFLQEVLADQYDTQLNRDINRLIPGNSADTLDPHLYKELHGRMGSGMDDIAFLMLHDQPMGLSDAKLSINYGRKDMPNKMGERPGPAKYIPPMVNQRNFEVDQDPVPSFRNSPLAITTPSHSARMMEADFWKRSMGVPSRPKLIRGDARGGIHHRFKFHAGNGYHRFGRHNIGGFMLRHHGFEPMGDNYIHHTEMGNIKNILAESGLNMVSSAMKSSRNKKMMKHLVSSGGGLKNVISGAVKSKAGASVANAIKFQAVKNMPTMVDMLKNGRSGITEKSAMDTLGNLKKIYGEGKVVKDAVLPKLRRFYDFIRRKKKTPAKASTIAATLSPSTPIKKAIKKMHSGSAPPARRRGGKGGNVKLNFLDFY